MSSSHKDPVTPRRNSPQEEVGEWKDPVQFSDLWALLTKGLPQILGLALLGLVIGAVGSYLAGRAQPLTTSTRVMFSFPGFERGEYPDKSKFQPDDLRSSSVIAEALRRKKIETSTPFQSLIRGSIGIEGVVSPNIVKERDRLRAAGQTPPPFIPDEYIIRLSLPSSNPLSVEQRNSLLNEVISVYRDQFTATYAQAPAAFGTAFTTLRQADFPEYQIILDKEIENISNYLSQLLSPRTSKDPDSTKLIERTSSFRSPTTNLSFKDLLEQTQLFSQIRLNETLGLIFQNGLSQDRATALVKMDYYLRVLENQEHRAAEEENVVRGLLSQLQERSQNYVLGIKSQAAAPARNDAPILDQTLIDSLLANDAYNFLVRQALQAGLKVKEVQAEKTRLVQLRENMKSFTGLEVGDKAQVLARVEKSLQDLETAYQRLITNIRDTQADFARQQFGDAIRLSSEIQTEGKFRAMAFLAALCGSLGLALGIGLSLLGISIRR